MNCDDFRAAYLAGGDDELLVRHVLECGNCRGIEAELDTVRSALADPSIWEEPPPNLEHQVVALISGRSDVGDRHKATRRWTWFAVSAAAVVLVIIAGLGLRASGQPDWTVTMPGTELAPEATSTVDGWNTPSGTRMVLEIDGLDPAPPGHTYELWLSRGAVHVSAGTFTTGGAVELGTGVRRAEFPRLWITLEPLDDDEGPSGLTVLDTGA